MVEDLLVYSHDLNSQESLSFSDKEEVSVLPLNLIQDEEEEENRRLKRRMKLKKKLGILLDKSNNNKEPDEVFELTKTEEDIEQQQNLSTQRETTVSAFDKLIQKKAGSRKHRKIDSLTQKSRNQVFGRCLSTEAKSYL